MAYLLTSDLKRRTGALLDEAALRPQFFTRNGSLFMLVKVDAADALIPTVEQKHKVTVTTPPALTAAEREQRNHVLRGLDDSEGW